MATTAPATAVPPNLNGAGTRPRSALPTRQRRPGYVALAVVLIVGLAAAGAYLYGQAGRKVPVVVVTHDVPAGHTITRADLSTVSVAGGVTAVAGAHLASVVGQVATVPLLAHTLLQRSMLTDASPLSAGRSLVGVAVRAGQIPADGLSPGDTVEIVALPPKDAAAAPGASTVLVPRAEIYSARGDPSSQGGTLLSLFVPATVAADVATASSAGQIALVQVAGR